MKLLICKLISSLSVSFIIIFSSYSIVTEDNKILAFPGADGYGKYTTGGRGGRIIIVDNLNDSGEGSFRAAIEAKGARIVIFKISGTIHLEKPVILKNPDITIAGQSAPGDGICIADQAFRVHTDNVIIRYMRFRLGDLDKVEDDATTGMRGKNIILDHCSMSWSIDETASYYDNENFTMQWCILSESLYNSAHTKGKHGYGGIWGGMSASFHHNLLAHHTSRNPRFCGARYHESTWKTELVDFRNNVIYNWGYNSSYAGEHGKINIVANYYKPGPATKKNVRSRILEAWASEDKNGIHDYGRFYIADNFVCENELVTQDNWKGIDAKNYVENDGIDEKPTGSVLDSILFVIRVKEAYPSGMITKTQTARETFDSVLKNAGASLKRDAVDQRVVEETSTGTATYGDSYGAKTGIIDTQASVGGWPELKSLRPLKDSDNDGMPDKWEIAHGLNPNDPSDATINSLDSKYNNIEIYINKLTK